MNEDRFSSGPSKLTPEGGAGPAIAGAGQVRASPAQSDWARIALFSPMLSVQGIETAGVPIKGRAVLAYLATQLGRPVPREKLADLVWSRSGIEQSRQSLRQALVILRRVLNPPAGTVAGATGQTDRLTDTLPQSLLLTGLTVDTLDFEALARGDGAEDWRRAIALYQGPLLAHFPPISEPFDDWLRLERTRLEDLAAKTLQRLAIHDLANGQPQQAVATAQRLLGLDPLREDAHRLLMRAYAEAGRRSDAMRYYGEVTALLKAELGVKPDAATTGLAEAIRKAVVEGDRVQVVPDPEPLEVEAQATPAIAISPAQARPIRLWPRRQLLVVGLTTLLVCIGVGLGWNRLRQPVEARPIYKLIPFMVLTDTPAANQFAAALTARLINGLGGIPYIRVIAPQTGQEGGDASYAINGTVEQGIGMMRVAAWISDPKTGKVLSSTHLGVAQREILEMASEALGVIGDDITIAINQLYFSYSLNTVEKQQADTLVKQARTLSDSAEDQQKTIDLLRKANNLDPNNLDVAGRLAAVIISEATNDVSDKHEIYYQQAKTILDKYDHVGHWHRLLSFANCEYLRNNGDLNSAINACNTTLNILPFSARVYKELGFIYQLMGQFDLSLASFTASDRLIRVGPVRWTWFYGAGITCLLMGKNQDAVDWLGQVAIVRSEHPPSHLMLAVAYHRLNIPELMMNELRIYKEIKGSLSIDDIMRNIFPNRINYNVDFKMRQEALRKEMQSILDDYK